jgi:two-component system CheB/CheR fusion protein
VKFNDDIENLLGAVEILILFVGIDLTVRRFNVTAGLAQPPSGCDRTASQRGEIGARRFSSREARGVVIETATAADVEVQDAAGDWRLLRIRAYRTSEGKIDGAIVAVLDINVLKRSVLVAEEATRAANMLSKASALLSSSLDYDDARVAHASLDGGVRGLVRRGPRQPGRIDPSPHRLARQPVLRDLALQFQEIAFKEPEHAGRLRRCCCASRCCSPTSPRRT